MLCSKCGAENENNAQFCFSCSYQLNEIFSIAPQPAIIVYAGFWRRFVAFLIDNIILEIVTTIFGCIYAFIIGYTFTVTGISEDTSKIVLFVGVCIFCIIFYWLYFTLLESSLKQATFGKMAIGIIVTDLNNNRISFGKANGRYWGKIVSAIILFIGFFMAGFTQKKQALHDIMAGTLVVKK
jgi:uncharacterized RDD family membrane protein YckC